MKPETKSFYETAVRRAVAHIAGRLDEALELAALARLAALSPFHFHRVFRGMVGETPLELHRRLRMERAAHRLLQGDAGVTAVALEAGYDTHEAFTRAFRSLYGAPPSAFRQASSAARAGLRAPPTGLAARSGIHYRPGAAAEDFIPFTVGEYAMNVDVKEMPAYRLATVPHVGPYHRIAEAFRKLGALAGPAGLFQYPRVAMIAVYHDDPETTPAGELRADAGLAVPDDAALPEGLGEVRLRGGRYARATHVGPYAGLGDAWARFMGEWLPQSGHRVGEGLSYEIYVNDPTTAAPHELTTELYLPLA